MREHAKGHNELADVLINREVIFTEDVEKIFGKRPWTSRTDEILAAQNADKSAKAGESGSDENASGSDASDSDGNIEDVEAEDVK